MQTIIDNENCSKYLFSDAEVISLKEKSVEIGLPVKYSIQDFNSSNATLVTHVNAPDDWYGCKYNYVNDAWELCPDWVDPRIQEEV